MKAILLTLVITCGFGHKAIALEVLDASTLPKSKISTVSEGEPWFTLVYEGKNLTLKKRKPKFRDSTTEQEDGTVLVDVTDYGDAGFFIRDSTLKEGAIVAAKDIESPKLNPSNNVHFAFGKIRGVMSASAKILPTNADNIIHTSDYKLQIKVGSDLAFIKLKSSGEGTPRIRWMGDINGDGFPDIFLETYERVPSPIFFLSRKNKGKFSYDEALVVNEKP